MSEFGPALSRVPIWSNSAKLLVVVLLVALAALGWTGEPKPRPIDVRDKHVSEEIRAKRISIIDSDGKDRASVGVEKDGAVRFVLRDKKGEARSWLSDELVAAPAFGVIGAQEQPLVELGSVDGRLPVLVMRDSAGKRRLALTARKTGGMILALNGRQGERRCTVAVGDDDAPELTLFDTAGQPRASIGARADGTCALDLFDGQGRPRISVHVAKGGEPKLLTFDSEGAMTWSEPMRD
jgi:hypothetical protein